jgi:hypothetical protein
MDTAVTRECLGRPSQRCGFYDDALLEGRTESSIRQHLHRASEDLLEVLNLQHIRDALDDTAAYHDQMCQCIQPE